MPKRRQLRGFDLKQLEGGSSLIGVDEAGAKFVGDTVALAAGVGVTLAIIRKGRILFWTALGLLLIIKRGLPFKTLSSIKRNG